MRVLILGCGPAGLIAASAADDEGAEIYIASQRARKSLILGAQYLHERIPNVDAPQFEIDYQLKGTIDGYRRKVYSGEDDISVSPDALIGKSPAWDIRSTYDQLWRDYAGAVEHWDASPDHLATLVAQLKPSIIISTIPAPLLCMRSHTFRFVETRITEYINGDFPHVDNTVVCSGEGGDLWSRKSRIQGWENTEYPIQHAGAAYHPRIREIGAAVKKPIDTNCDCYPDVNRMGRFGRWTKGVLSHTAYTETVEIIQKWRLR